METISYLIIVSIFMLYYLLVLMFEKRIIQEPTEIIEKFLAITLAYAGISLIYFSFTGKPFLTDNVSEYYIYIFIIGFIAILWAIPNLLSEFGFFRRFVERSKRRRKK